MELVLSQVGCGRAARRWRRPNGSVLLGNMLEGVEFRDGLEVERCAA